MSFQRSRSTPDLIVVGAGAAGMSAALDAAEQGALVTLVSARPLAETASYWAQGGLAAAVGADDSVELHVADTLTAGRRLVHEPAARTVCGEAPDRLLDLQRRGVPFDPGADGAVALGLEGGHSRRRIVHAGGGATGRRILATLADRIAEEPRVHVLSGRRVDRLLLDPERTRVIGVLTDDGRRIAARAVLLASGGSAALWARTTNPPGSWGSGLLLARSAGATLIDLEFVQFHPTAVTGIAGLEGFLVSEAARGEGATLLSEGERFVDELAPRDAVALAIHQRLAHGPVLLDMREVDPARFPGIFTSLREAGHDPAAEPVPVAPAAHYVMGGVQTDLQGRTDVPGLLAIGETACTGLHGANRLASNSLSECFVMARRAALHAIDLPMPPAERASRETTAPAGTPAPPDPATREAMWHLVGLARSPEGLRRLLDTVAHPLARLVAAAALAREESRGAHVRVDAPEVDPRLDELHGSVAADTTTSVLGPWDRDPALI